jgi:hypothetical protein
VEARQRLLADVDLREANALKAIADKYAQAKFRQGGGAGASLADREAELERDANLAELRAKATAKMRSAVGAAGNRALAAAQAAAARDEERRQRERARAEAAQQPKPERVTDTQRQIGGLYDAAKTAFDLYAKTGISDEGVRQIAKNARYAETVKNLGFVGTGLTALGVGSELYAGVSPSDQIADQAFNQALDAYTKFITGAGQSNEEAARRAAIFRPVPGESKEARANKVRAFGLAIESMRKAGGTTVQSPAAPAPQLAPAAPATPADAVRVGRDKKTGAAVFRAPDGSLFLEMP